MVYFRSAFVIALLVASPGLAEASSVKSPKKADARQTSKQDNSLQTFKAKKVESSTISEALSKTSSNGEPSETPKSKTTEHHNGAKLQRQMMEARTTLENVNIDNLEPAEIMFYEDSLKKAVEMAQDQDDTGNQVSLRSVIVEDDHDNQKKHGRRGLRGGRDHNGSRALWGWSSNWYDIWAVVEVFSCRFCGSDDDDDYFQTRVVENTRNRRFDDDDDYMGVTPMRDIDHGYHRALGVSDSFESILCNLLREGPHERFHKVKSCVLQLDKW